MISEPDHLLIFDTTLQGCEHARRGHLTGSERLLIARALVDLGVDIIEVGAPAVSQIEWEGVAAIAGQIQGPIICGRALCKRRDIELTGNALLGAPRPRLHVFLAPRCESKDEYSNALGKIIRTAREGVSIARERCDDVQFSLSEAPCTESDFLVQIVETVIERGATTVNIADIGGYALPYELTELFIYLRKNVRGIDRIVLSVQCLDRLRIAVANSLAAVMGGARQVQCAINGVGAYAGACSLEDVVTVLHERHSFFDVRTSIRSSRFSGACHLVSTITRMPNPWNKAHAHQKALNRETSELVAKPIGCELHDYDAALSVGDATTDRNRW